jgi:PTS system ascorbate-specific IIA component
MTGLLVIAHAPLASSLKAVAEHAYPDGTSHLQALDVTDAMTPEDIEAAARAILLRMEQREALIFTDVFGATPCNVAQRLADGVTSKVVTGVNVPMLWRALCYAAEPLDMVVARAVAGATQGVMQVAVSRPQNQAQPAGAHDQAHHHHQQ